MRKSRRANFSLWTSIPIATKLSISDLLLYAVNPCYNCFSTLSSIQVNPRCYSCGVTSYYLTRNSESGNIGYELNQKRVDKTMLSAGFFSSVAHGIDADAQGMMDLYATRDVQEKYFEEMKNQLGFSMQRNSTEDGKTGRLFILFILKLVL